MAQIKFDYTLNYAALNMRERPDLYRTGVGEQGVLLVEPYKSELLPLWKFRTPQMARASAGKIYKLFLVYVRAHDFVGMDMARKFLQMGFTRSRRYANHRSGKKYLGPVPEDQKGRSGSHGRALLPPEVDVAKAKSAAIFLIALKRAKQNKKYATLLAQHKAKSR